MKNCILGIFFLFTTISELRAEITDREIAGILTYNKAHWGPPDIGWQITFLENGAAEYYFAWEGSRSVRAKYEISKGEIFISITGPAAEHDLKWLGKRTKCHLVNETDSLEFLYSLACNNKTKVLLSHGHKRVDQETTIDSLPAVTLGGKRATALATVKFREAPNVSAGTIYCKLQNSQGGVIPKGNDRIFVLARSKDKAKVENMENYWYYIRIYAELYDGESCKKDRGWVFGEFIRLLP